MVALVLNDLRDIPGIFLRMLPETLIQVLYADFLITLCLSHAIQ